MNLFKLFKSKRDPSAQTASIAKERLQILVTHERANQASPSYLPALQQELLAVMRKYTHIDDEAVQVHFEQSDTRSMLELNVTLSD